MYVPGIGTIRASDEQIAELFGSVMNFIYYVNWISKKKDPGTITPIFSPPDGDWKYEEGTLNKLILLSLGKV